MHTPNVRAAMVNDRLSLDDFSSTDALQPAPAFSMLINRTANNPNGVVSLTPYFDTGLGGPGQAGPENNNTVRMPAANAKALGLTSYDPTLLDGIITFTSSAIFDFDRSDGIAANKIDFVGVAAHEIGHVLGFTSGVDVLVGNGAPPGLNDNQLKFVTPLDLFRFTSRSIGAGGGIGVIDWTGDDTDKYFSVDGGLTPLANFSNGTTYEEDHWQNDAGIGIMDPTAGVRRVTQDFRYGRPRHGCDWLQPRRHRTCWRFQLQWRRRCRRLRGVAQGRRNASQLRRMARSLWPECWQQCGFRSECCRPRAGDDGAPDLYRSWLQSAAKTSQVEKFRQRINVETGQQRTL